MSVTTDPILREKYRETYKVRCASTNKCKRCPRQNDNPTSFICRDCTVKHRLYQRGRQAA